MSCPRGGAPSHPCLWGSACAWCVDPDLDKALLVDPDAPAGVRPNGVIALHGGGYISPTAFEPDDFSWSQMAWHCGNLCRFTGAGEFYSVAQHMVFCDSLVRAMFPRSLWGAAFVGLLSLAVSVHDGSEAWWNDLNRPVKVQPGMSWYREQEHAAGDRVFQKAGIDPYGVYWRQPLHRWIKLVDDVACMAERDALLPHRDEWKDMPESPPTDVVRCLSGNPYKPWQPKQARVLYMKLLIRHGLEVEK